MSTKIYCCNICKFTSVRKFNLIRHQLRHEKKDSFDSDESRDVNISEKNVNIFEDSVNIFDECPKCKKKF